MGIKVTTWQADPGCESQTTHFYLMLPGLFSCLLGNSITEPAMEPTVLYSFFLTEAPAPGVTVKSSVVELKKCMNHSKGQL